MLAETDLQVKAGLLRALNREAVAGSLTQLKLLSIAKLHHSFQKSSLNENLLKTKTKTNLILYKWRQECVVQKSDRMTRQLI